ncbi:FlhC family transcriptional regulator [Escherichia coli]
MKPANQANLHVRKGPDDERKKHCSGSRDIQLAMELITLGAHLQMLESETQLSHGAGF